MRLLSALVIFVYVSCCDIAV